MALIKCSECGKEISDKAEQCPKCGFPLMQSKPAKSNKNSKIKKLIPIIAVVIALIISIVAITCISSVNPEKTYEEAITFLENGEFAQAIEKFKEIPDYPDAKEMLDVMASKYSGVSDDTYFAGMYIISIFNSNVYDITTGPKLRTCIASNFGDAYNQTSGNEVVSAVKEEDYITTTLDLIEKIPVSSSKDKEFKSIVYNLYLMRLDGIFANYVQNSEHNSTLFYRTMLKIYGLEDEKLYDLYTLVNEGEKTLKFGDGDISDLTNSFKTIASITMFDDFAK